MSNRSFGAIDIGASGGRVMVGSITNHQIELEAVHRFPNQVTEVDGHLRWDIDELHRQVVVGIDALPDVESLGIDTWAVDYGLLDDQGALLAAPIAYRDERTNDVIAGVHERVSPSELYAINGLQFLPFNTIYQFAAEQSGPLWNRAAHAVLLPDLLAQRLCGRLRTEITNGSTTGLLDARTHRWSPELLERLSIPDHLLPPLQDPGEARGTTLTGTPLITVGSHDTASAVVAVPATTERFAYIASGTWSLVGLELPTPVLTEAARTANFTNELGVDGRTRFLRNLGGLWLLQECMRTWGRHDLEALLDEAAASPTSARIDVDDAAFIPPDDMPERITRAAGRAPLTPAETVRCILASLAESYARTLRQATELSGQAVDIIHVVGGGSQNELLCQLTADAAALPVVAGPVEATALGNILIQARAHGAAPPTLEDLRHLVARSTALRRYEPA